MKLYASRRAPNPRRVLWVMAEKGVADIEVVDIDLMKQEHKTPEYRAKVDLPVVPALELDDGLVITESLAIARYLESLYPEPNLFGRDPRETAVIEMWTRRAEMMVATPLMLSVRHGHPALAALETQSAEVAQTNKAQAERSLRVLDRRLAESEFLAADRVTIADIVAVSGLDFSRMIQFRPDPELTHVHRWYEAMRARPAASATAGA